MKVLKTITLPRLEKYQGKVRDIYIDNDKRILITTDRQSAFDIMLGHIPYKGTVLNLLSQYWFEKTKHIVQNHMLEVPDPNVMIVKNCKPIPVEMVVRGYMTGVTTTSIWSSYKKGERLIYGIRFPNGMKKNQKLFRPIITPTTHPEAGAGMHDERLTKKEILKKRLVEKKLYEQMEKISLKLFALGQKMCKGKGLILVDTKYEFGLSDGELVLIDEVHTPDSSRFWIKKTYPTRFKKGLEPENFDKEFLRLWYTNRGYVYGKKPQKMSKQLISSLSKRYVDVYEKLTGKNFSKYSYPIEKRILKNLDPLLKRKQSIKYGEVGDDYDTKDPIKKFAQVAALQTARNLKQVGFAEIQDSRGESAYVWKQGNYYMAAVAEQLGTKNLVADAMRKITGKTYYDIIAQDTVATIINDLATSGARPLVVHAYWAVENNAWLADKKRIKNLVAGWKKACDLSGASWGGGETPTLKGIIEKDTAALGGSAIGIIRNKKRLMSDKNIRSGDRIILLRSNGINANGLSLARAIAKKLKKGYRTKLSNGKMYGEALLTKSNLYPLLIQALLDRGIEIHYLVNITGHGFRKLMRARFNFSYYVEKIFKPQEIFTFIQKHANLTEYDMYDEFNMGMDFAIYLPKDNVKKALRIIKAYGYKALDAGYIEKGERKVVIKPNNLVFTSERLDLR